MEEWLMTADAGRELNLTPAGVRWLVLTGKLPVGGKTVSGFHLFRKDDVDRLQEEREGETANRRYLCSVRR